MSEKEQETTAQPSQPSRAEAIANIQAIREKLKRQEAIAGPSGADPNMRRADMLDASDVQALHPDKRIRWGSLRNEAKMQRRQAEGYERLSLADGGRQVGNLVLMGVSREIYERKVEQDRQLRKERLRAHQTEVEKAAEGIAKALRDQHGVKIDARDFLISE